MLEVVDQRFRLESMVTTSIDKSNPHNIRLYK